VQTNYLVYSSTKEALSLEAEASEPRATACGVMQLCATACIVPAVFSLLTLNDDSSSHAYSAHCYSCTMSGIELAGLVLGAIPVAQASYAIIGNFFRAWRGADTQLTRLQKLHKIEANMFRVSVRVLFSGLLAKATVTEMLDQPSHRLWKDKSIHGKLGSILNEDLDVSEAININIELAKKTLSEIEDVFRGIAVRYAV
jgi:hypothetical protein